MCSARCSSKSAASRGGRTGSAKVRSRQNSPRQNRPMQMSLPTKASTTEPLLSPGCSRAMPRKAVSTMSMLRNLMPCPAKVARCVLANSVRTAIASTWGLMALLMEGSSKAVVSKVSASASIDSARGQRTACCSSWSCTSGRSMVMNWRSVLRSASTAWLSANSLRCFHSRSSRSVPSATSTSSSLPPGSRAASTRTAKHCSPIINAVTAWGVLACSQRGLAKVGSASWALKRAKAPAKGATGALTFEVTASMAAMIIRQWAGH